MNQNIRRSHIEQVADVAEYAAMLGLPYKVAFGTAIICGMKHINDYINIGNSKPPAVFRTARREQVTS